MANQFTPGTPGWAIVLEDKTYQMIPAALNDKGKVPREVDNKRVVHWSNSETDLKAVFANLTA